MTLTQDIRDYLADRYNCDPNTDIETEGQSVHVTGTTPNTNEVGQFFAGYLGDIQHEMEREQR